VQSYIMLNSKPLMKRSYLISTKKSNIMHVSFMKTMVAWKLRKCNKHNFKDFFKINFKHESVHAHYENAVKCFFLFEEIT